MRSVHQARARFDAGLVALDFLDSLSFRLLWREDRGFIGGFSDRDEKLVPVSEPALRKAIWRWAQRRFGAEWSDYDVERVLSVASFLGMA